MDSPAKGKVHAKTGTFLADAMLKAQVLAGYIGALSGRRLLDALYVNNAGQITGIPDVVDMFQDEGLISSIIYQLN